MRRAALITVLVSALSGCFGGPDDSAVPPPSAARLAPDANGLQPSGTTLRIDFGRAQAGVIETVSRLLRAGPDRVVTNQECGAGAVTAAEWPNGLTLNFREGDFEGWVVDAPGLPVAGGLSAGMPLPNLPLRDTTLGTEFETGGIFGLSTDGASIELLWSGTTCFFR